MRKLKEEYFSNTSQAAGPRPISRAASSVFPGGARAIIARTGRSVTSSAPQRGRPWRLRFERRAAPTIEPLMGWTSDSDPVAQVELAFPTLEAAIRYAERQGIAYRVVGGYGAGTKIAREHARANAAIGSRLDETRNALAMLGAVARLPSVSIWSPGGSQQVGR